MDDEFVSSTDQLTVDVLANDLVGAGAQIVEVSDPEVGSVSVLGTQLVVDLPESYSGVVMFTYTVLDASGATSTASVSVVSANVLSSVTEVADVDPSIDSVGAVLERTGQLFEELLTIRLSSIQLSALAVAPFFLGLVGLAVMRRELLLSITGVPRTELANFVGKTTRAARHDALVWGRETGRRRRFGRTQVRIELASGETVWIDPGYIQDTGF